jgi:perosamine synthetase
MIPVAEPWLGEKELEYVTDCVRSGWISSIGKYVEMFEEKFSKYCGTKYGVSTSNGTTALHLALATLGIKKGDEVIIPDLTFVATANAVTYCNAKPNLYVIEDAAEAHGAEYKGKKAGSFGDISCFSFYGNKIITTGEGGMCLTDTEELAEKARMLRDHAMSKEKRYWHEVIGFNYRLTNLQAAVGVAQLEKIDKIIEIKRRNAELYSEELKDLEGTGLIISHPEMKWAKCVYWMYCILIEDKLGISRDDTRPFFYPMHVIPPYKNNKRFQIAEEISRKGINLPSGVSLTKEMIKEIVSTIKTNFKI